MKALEGKHVLVTGGAGAFGKQFLKTVADARPASVTVLSRDEMKHTALRRDFGPATKSWLRLRLGDVTRPEDCALALKDAQVVIHAAAMKHLPECEANPAATTLGNVTGTHNVVQAFLRSNAETLVFLSTDKAPYASTVYGAQKLIAEKLVGEAAQNHGRRAFTLRYSNVIDSTGAAFLLFKQLLSEGKTVTVNGSQTSRGFLSQAQVMNFLGKTLEVAKGGEVFVMVPRVILIAEMARTMKKLIGKGDVVVNETAGFAGEKESATLIMAEEAGATRELPECQDPPGFLVDPLAKHPTREPAKSLAGKGFTLEDCPRFSPSELEQFLGKLI